MSNKVFKKMKSDRFLQVQRRKVIKAKLKKQEEEAKIITPQEQKALEEKEVLDAIANIDRRKKIIRERLIKEGYEQNELTWLNH